MFWVYILRCSDGSYYTGHTDNLEKRFHEHQSGTRTGYTSTRKPVELAYNQTFSTREKVVIGLRCHDYQKLTLRRAQDERVNEDKEVNT
jgi:predicted GIY-YIG superfamily endonuclease